MPHRAMITFIIVFTMLFNGGLVPGYLLIKKLGLINTVWALILPIICVYPFVQKYFVKGIMLGGVKE